eukprot:m.43699 g.43699  ORF g.43699 m.43699 type:complete len:89 (-) comp7123_c1_seq4:104-370(-)
MCFEILTLCALRYLSNFCNCALEYSFLDFLPCPRLTVAPHAVGTPFFVPVFPMFSYLHSEFVFEAKQFQKSTRKGSNSTSDESTVKKK